MGYQQPVDHLALWRGIDDAIWREATRTIPAEPGPEAEEESSS